MTSVSVLAPATAALLVAGLGGWLLLVPDPSVRRLVDALAVDPGHRGRPFVERLGRPLRATTAWSVRGRFAASLRTRLDAAGLARVTATEVADRRAGFALLAVVTAVFLARDDHPVLAVVIGVAVLAITDVTLSRRARARQDDIERALPDVLDTLAVALRAGGTFRPTVARLVSTGTGPLVEELGTTLGQMDLGVPRREAFAALERRNVSPLLRRFAHAVLQAEELGTSLSQTLSGLAGDMRRRSTQMARERADRVEKRVVLVNAALFLPAMMLMLVAVSLIGFGVSGALGS